VLRRWRPIAGGVGLLLLAIAGLHVYVTATATPLHPDPNGISSVTRSAPASQWADAVERGRQVARASLVEQNLPGLSVAVGVRGDLVWAEGFGWADLENRVPVAPDRRFRIGTASTMLTSAGVGLLLENGQLRLDDPIRRRKRRSSPSCAIGSSSRWAWMPPRPTPRPSRSPIG
jgi:serine beta-lactamase-like protein LACTB, mitochondrial